MKLKKEQFRYIGETVGAMPTTLSTFVLITIVMGASIGFKSPLLSEYHDIINAVAQPLIQGSSFAIIYLFLIMTSRIYFPKANNTGIEYEVAAAGRMVKSNYLTEDEYHRCCVHEAGHILSFRLYEQLPDEIRAWVKKVEFSPNGNVYGNYKNTPSRLSHLRERMLTKLSGYCAEEVVFGHANIGSRNDITTWEDIARDYLGSSLHIGYKWFTNPSNVHEAEVNINTLREIRTDLWIDLEKFLTINKSVLLDVAESLKTKDVLGSEDLTPFINRAII